MTMPALTVITVSLNAATHIERAIRSATMQTCEDMEYIIVDGGSTDGTDAIIKRNRDRISQFVSEPDNGLYDAMNKGVALAHGEVLYFLNADDYLVDDTVLADMQRSFQETGADIIYGNLYWDMDGKRVMAPKPRQPDRRWLAQRTIMHQGLFARRRVFDRIGGFATDLRVVADYDWILRAFLDDDIRWSSVERDIAVMATGGLSWRGGWEGERLRVMRRYFSCYEILRHRVLPRSAGVLRRALGR